VINIICQTFFYGIYFCLFPISIYVMVTKGLQGRSRKWLFAMIIIMFTLSTMNWIMCIVSTFIMIDVCQGLFGVVPCKLPDWLPIVNAAFQPINFIFTDGVVVWRAWALCSDQNRTVLMFPVIILGINTLLYLFTVAISAGMVIVLEAGRESMGIHLNHVIVSTQVANLALSLLTNIFATSLIAVKAWKFRKTLMTSGVGIRNPPRVIRILALIVESGMLYIFIGVVALVSLFIHLPFGTLSDIFALLTSQFAGMYPILVLLLVETNRSLDTTCFSSSSIIDSRGGQRSEMGPMSFAAGPVHATGSQIEIESQASQPRVDLKGHDGASVKATSLPDILPTSSPHPVVPFHCYAPLTASIQYLRP